MKAEQSELLALALQEISLVQERLRVIEQRLAPSGVFSTHGRFSLCPRCRLTYLTGKKHVCPEDEVEG